jgi:transposase
MAVMKSSGNFQQQHLDWWSDALLLEDFEVVHQTEDQASQSLQFTLIPKVTAAVCPHCGTLQSECHQKRDRDGIRDLPMGQRSVVLRIRVFEYRCSRCEKMFTPPCPAVAPGTHATERFLERAAQLIRHGDIQNAAVFLKVPEKTLERWYYEYVERRQQQPQVDLKPITSIGIDELSQKKDTASSWP